MPNFPEVKKYKSFTTERLIIRPTIEYDAAFVFELLNTPKWIKFIGDRNVKSSEQAQHYIRSRMLTQLDRLGYGNYTIIRKTDGEKVGICGLYDREGLDGIDLGFALLPNFEKQGFAYEASARLKKAALEDFGISKLVAITDQENLASQSLLHKLGFEKAGLVQLSPNKTELILYQYQKNDSYS